LDTLFVFLQRSAEEDVLQWYLMPKIFEDYLTLIDEKDIKFTEGRAGL
jgi:hypothetical protein